MLNLIKPVRMGKNRGPAFTTDDELNLSTQSPTSLLLQTNTHINILGTENSISDRNEVKRSSTFDKARKSTPIPLLDAKVMK